MEKDLKDKERINNLNSESNKDDSRNKIDEATKAVEENQTLEEEKKDIFDKIMLLPGLRYFNKFYKKNKSVLLYIFFGGLTTLVSLGSFALFNYAFNIDVLISNIISWVCAVTFAYITNRSMVFHSKAKGWKIPLEMLQFYAGRLFSLGVEELILWIFVSELGLNDILIKVIAQIIILVLNYVISKILFKTRKKKVNKTI